MKTDVYIRDIALDSFVIVYILISQSFLQSPCNLYAWLHQKQLQPRCRRTRGSQQQYRLISQSMSKTFTVHGANAALILHNLRHLSIRAGESSSIYRRTRSIRRAILIGRAICLFRPRELRRTERTIEQVVKIKGNRLSGESHGATNLGGQLASRQHFDFAFLGAFARLSARSLLSVFVAPEHDLRPHGRPFSAEQRPRTLPGAAPPCSFVLTDPGSTAPHPTFLFPFVLSSRRVSAIGFETRWFASSRENSKKSSSFWQSRKNLLNCVT